MRTLEQIKSEMDAVQATIPELSAINSSSQVSFFAHLKNMWALLVQLVESDWDAFKLQIETLLSGKRTGSASWYVEQVLKFQYGDRPTVIGGQITYEIIDPTKQIIKQAACVEDMVSGRLLIKAVKQGSGLVALNSNELTALKNYIADVKFAGVQVDVSSLPADLLKLSATIKYDPQVLSSTGALLSDPTQFPVRAAIMAYLTQLPFNSVFSWTLLTDYIQTVPGVLDFVITASEIAPNATNFWSSFQRETVSNAGHMILQEETLTYI